MDISDHNLNIITLDEKVLVRQGVQKFTGQARKKLKLSRRLAPLRA
jgi:hypothetical protein